jgi:bifunctional enzyme Fae/Hps
MLDKKQKYLQIALNSTLNEARNIIGQIPLDKRIIIEAGTPLLKAYGALGIKKIRSWWEERIFGPSAQAFRTTGMVPLVMELIKKSAERKREKIAPFTPYIVADLKCMDRGTREAEIAREGGANAVTALGHAPIETLDAFIENCQKSGLDSMIDMMNVGFPLEVLRQLKNLPSVVVLHRGVDEEFFNPEKEIPFHEIQRIKTNYDIMIAVAGGDTFEEARRALFNDADIVVVWKSFYKSADDTAKIAEEFLKEIR